MNKSLVCPDCRAEAVLAENVKYVCSGCGKTIIDDGKQYYRTYFKPFEGNVEKIKKLCEY